MSKPRHKATKKRQIITSALSTLIAGALLSTAGAAYGAQQNPDGSITVESGDTLSAIAQQFGGTYHEYSGYKSGDPNLIYPGEQVKHTTTRTITETKQTISDEKLTDLAWRTIRGEFGNNPERHDTLANLLGEPGAQAVQRLVDQIINEGGTQVTDEVRQPVTTTTTRTVSEPAANATTEWVDTAPTQVMPEQVQPTVTPNTPTTQTSAPAISSDVPQSTPTQNTPAQNQSKPNVANNRKRVWIVDVKGHYETVWVDEDVYSTRVVPATYKNVETVVTPEHVVEVEVEPARTEVVHHDAEYKTIPAVTKQVVDTPEQVVNHLPVTHEEPVYETKWTDVYTFPDGYVVSGRGPSDDEFMDHGDPTITQQYQQVLTGYKTVVDKEAWNEIIPATYKTIEVEPARTELVKEAWDEYVSVPAKTEKRVIPAVTRVDKVVDVAEHTETYKSSTRKVEKQQWVAEQGHWQCI